MRNNAFALFFLLAILNLGFAQEYPERDKKYDFQIYEYLDSITNGISLEVYLYNSKPFSKWDVGPLYKPKVWAFDTVYTAGEVSNFMWGAFASKYLIPRKEAKDYANRFLQQGIDAEGASVKKFEGNLSKFEDLSQKIELSKNYFFVSQAYLQRVDDVYKEGEIYWKYLIPSDSPFPMSNSKDETSIAAYTEEQTQVLDLLKELSIYAVVKTTNGIFYLIDGFTDNSYGYYYSKSGKMETDNFLFNILASRQINPNFYYYVAN